MGIVGGGVIVVLVVALCIICFKLGYNTAWNYVSTNYIAIHKSAVIWPIIIKRHTNHKEGVKYEKNHEPKGTGKKAFK